MISDIQPHLNDVTDWDSIPLNCGTKYGFPKGRDTDEHVNALTWTGGGEAKPLQGKRIGPFEIEVRGDTLDETESERVSCSEEPEANTGQRAPCLPAPNG